MSDPGIGAQRLHLALTRFQGGDPTAAQAAALEALESFSAASDRTGAAAALQLLGILAVSAGDFEEAINHLEAALPLRESTGDLEGVASLLQERFELALRVGDLVGAQRAMERQADVQERHGDREGHAHALHQLAQLHLQQGQDGVAEALIQRAIFSLTGPGTERARSALALLYASIWMARRDYPRALAQAQQGLDLAKQAHFRPAEVDAQQQIGVVLAMAGEYARAKRALEDALVGRELLKDPEGRFAVLRELAEVELRLGEVESGLSRLDHAVRAAASLGHTIGEITGLQLLQVASDEAGQPERALAAARRLLQAAQTLGEEEALAAAHFSLATRLAARGELPEAEVGFDAARQLHRKLGLRHEEAVATGMLGQVQVASGKPEGRKLLEQSLSVLEELGSEAAESVREILAEVGS